MKQSQPLLTKQIDKNTYRKIVAADGNKSNIPWFVED